MHRIDITEAILARARAVRGGQSFLARLDPATTAHVVIDMQEGFLRPGAILEVPQAREIVGRINGISAALRASIRS